MDQKLYVGNLSDYASVDALRRRFEECGGVRDVHLATDRSSGRARGYAFITMMTPAAAQRAKSQLNGALFEDRPLRVSDAGEEREGSRSRTHNERPGVKITSQFRERTNMAYELDCQGVELLIRVFLADDQDDEMWRMEATMRKTIGMDPVVVTGTAPTRALALQDLGHSWQEQTLAKSLRTVDWPGIREALAAVRAI